tara:strand:- start:412 stop:729 length:318 start_codon:yes stop_codon:yes gene_type:complete
LSSKKDNEDLEQVKIIKKKISGHATSEDDTEDLNKTNVNEIQSPPGIVLGSFLKPPQIEIIAESLEENNTEIRHSPMSTLKPVNTKVTIPNLELKSLKNKNEEAY